MDPAVQGALIAAGIAIVSLLINAFLENRRGHRDAAERTAARTAEATARELDRNHERAERRYEDRLAVLNEFLAEADRLLSVAMHAEYNDNYGNGMGSPSDRGIDGPDIESVFATLRSASSRLDLVASEDCRQESQKFEQAVVTAYTYWGDSAWTKASQLRSSFLTKARRDLALPEPRAGSGLTAPASGEPMADAPGL